MTIVLKYCSQGIQNEVIILCLNEKRTNKSLEGWNKIWLLQWRTGKKWVYKEWKQVESNCCPEGEFEARDEWDEASDNILKTMREMRWSEVECKDLRANGREVMGCGDGRRRRCGSGEAENEDAKEAWEGAERAAGWVERDGEVKANKARGNGVVETADGEEIMGKAAVGRAGDERTSNSFTSSIPVRELSLLRPLQLCSALSLIPGLSNMPC